jgi:hypothetical protein
MQFRECPNMREMSERCCGLICGPLSSFVMDLRLECRLSSTDLACAKVMHKEFDVPLSVRLETPFG